MPNVFTVLADTTAAFVLVAGGVEPLGRYTTVLLSVCCLYWAGMILNDLWDLEIDREERPERPLPSGRISLSAAGNAGWGLMLAGIGLALASGYVSADGFESHLLPMSMAMLLALSIVFYDGTLKKTPVAPLAMGACRVFSFLLGASAAMPAMGGFPFFAEHQLAIGLGFGTYIIGVTMMARGEAIRQNRTPVVAGLLVTIVGLAVIAMGPRFFGGETPFYVDTSARFPILIGLLSLSVLVRSIRAVVNPEPAIVQMNIRTAILTLIPLSAAVALLGAGQTVAVGVFGLIVPALYLGSFLRIT